ncbi:MAG TPA: lipid-binding SYLF domain-containing protein [Geobacteraceae bacterium]
MKKSVRLLIIMFLLALVVHPRLTYAASKADIDRDAKAALETLYQSTPAARQLAEKAKGILVFPSIFKGGLIVGAQYGDGALFKNGKVVGYYNSVAGSYGLQAGVQKFGYAMFFMNDAALAYLNKSKGWEIGVGPSVVVVDKESAVAFGKSLTTSTLKDDIYAFIFSQKGLMAGLGLQGSKITRIEPD